MKKWIFTALGVCALVLPAAAFAGADMTADAMTTRDTLGVPMVAQAIPQSDRAISYGTRQEPVPNPGVLAGAVTKQLWHSDGYDRIASTLAGFPIVAVGEDDDNEWASILGDDAYAVLGFTMVYAPSSSPFYHQIFLAPRIWSTLNQIESGGIDSVPRADAAMAVLTLTHEAYHQRLYSGDESRVNACALRDFGSTIQSQFGISPTVEQTVTTPVVTRHLVRQAIWRTVKGKRVRRYVYRPVSQTTYRNDTVVADNPTYGELVSSAQSFVASQPPPYNTGTCF